MDAVIRSKSNQVDHMTILMTGLNNSMDKVIETKISQSVFSE